jgi:ribose 5-phosphate isomerase A
MPDQDRLKKAAAEAAVALVIDGMIVGLGTGSTARFVLEAIGRRVNEGLRVIGIPTSDRSAEQARERGIPVSTLGAHRKIDLTIDGADEVERGSLRLIKGLGGALLHEKIVASASKQLVIVVDESKLVGRLGEKVPVPVEVVPFGWEATNDRLKLLGAIPRLREGTDGKAFVTDSGNYILDCFFGVIPDSAALQRELDGVVGVVEHGLFLGLATQVIVGGAENVQTLRP